MSVFYPGNIEYDRLAVENTMLQEANRELLQDEVVRVQVIEDLHSRMMQIIDRFDGIGWQGADDTALGKAALPLDAVKKYAEVCRDLVALNPFVKRGVDARVQYIWGKGVLFDGIEDKANELEVNRVKLFSAQANTELEVTLATDGNAFTLLPVNSNASAVRVPLAEISDAISDPQSYEDIRYYKRSYSVYRFNRSTGQSEPVQVERYYVSLPYHYQLKDAQKKLPGTINRVKVDQDYVMHHMTVNRQTGWRWGLPDVAAVVPWARAYKEYLENQSKLVEAYSSIAFQFKGNSAAGNQQAASQLREQPSRDSRTGEVRDVGRTVITGGELTALPVSGSQVDFDKGSALAAAIAAGLGVSKVVVLSDPGSGNRSAAETLDGPTRKAMETRQQLHVDRFLDVFQFWGLKISEQGKPRPKTFVIHEAASASVSEKKDGGAPRDFVTVVFPPIDSDSTKDRIAAIGTAVELGILFEEEARREALEVLKISPYKSWSTLPEKPEIQPSVIPSQGNSGGISARGGTMTDDNEARDNRDDDSEL